MNDENLNKLITEALAIEEKDAKRAGAIGYMARVLVQATLPHKNIESSVFERSNGKFSLAIMGHPKIGLPYGIYPRLLITWLATEAVKTKKQTLILGNNLNDFMGQLGLISTGGRWGTIWRLRDQMRRLFSSTISYSYTDKNLDKGIGFTVSKEYQLWWEATNDKQNNLWESSVTLSTDFYNELIERPIPIDMRALKALKSSSMAMDLYCWLTYRFSYLKKETEIPWILLQSQFGSDYAEDNKGRYEFKRKLKKQLQKVLVVYEGARVRVTDIGLVLSPSISHVKK